MDQAVQNEPFRHRLRASIANFIQKNRAILFIGIILIVVVLAGLAIWTIYDGSVKADFAGRIEKLDTDFYSWKTETDSSKKSTLAASVEGEIKDIQAKAPNSYGLLKAYLIQGQYFVESKQWTNAAAAFKTIYQKDSTSYLAPVGLLNAGVCYENTQDYTNALTTYNQFLKAYPKDSMYGAQIYFSIAHIYEELAKTSDAVASYKKVLTNFPESEWAKLSRDRLAVLE